MKPLQLVNDVKKRYAKMDKALKRIIKDFAVEDIHLFRLEVKKLRSLLRLACTVKRKGSTVKLPERLHQFYNAIGTIRSLQLQQQCIKTLPQWEYAILLKPYLSFVNKEIDERITLARKLVKGEKPFSKGRKKLLKQLPSNLRSNSIRKFISQKLVTLTLLMQPSSLSDESLHAVRKLLKDILNTWSFGKERTSSIPLEKIMSKEEISSIIKILGDFQDQCVGLDLLHTHYKKQQTGLKGRIVWRRLENKWWSEKESSREEIHSLFNKGFLLQLNSQQYNGKYYFPLPIKLLAL